MTVAPASAAASIARERQRAVRRRASPTTGASWWQATRIGATPRTVVSRRDGPALRTAGRLARAALHGRAHVRPAAARDGDAGRASTSAVRRRPVRHRDELPAGRALRPGGDPRRVAAAAPVAPAARGRRVRRASRCVDWGDLAVTPGQRRAAPRGRSHDGLAPAASRPGITPLVLGGDHSIVLGELRAHAERRTARSGSCCSTPTPTPGTAYYGERYFHGTPFRRALEEGLLGAGALDCSPGCAARSTRPQDLDEPRGWGFEIVPCDELRALTPGRVRASGCASAPATARCSSRSTSTRSTRRSRRRPGRRRSAGLLPHEALAFLRALGGPARSPASTSSRSRPQLRRPGAGDRAAGGRRSRTSCSRCGPSRAGRVAAWQRSRPARACRAPRRRPPGSRGPCPFLIRAAARATATSSRCGCRREGPWVVLAHPDARPRGLHGRPGQAPRGRGERDPSPGPRPRGECSCSTARSTCASAACCSRRSTASGCSVYERP